MLSYTLMTVLLVFDVWRDVCIRMDEKACIIGRAEAVKPVLDLANNMRMVLVPADTSVGTPIYKLRASDADENYPLEFRIFDGHRTIYRGQRESRMVEITNVDCVQSICEAYVILKQPLKFGSIDNQFDIHKIKNESSQTISKTEVKVKAGFLVAGDGYDLTLEIRDKNGETTVLKSHLHPTAPLNAFVGSSRIIRIPETTEVGTRLDTFYIRSNPKSFRGIACNLIEYGGSSAVLTEPQSFSLSSAVPARTKGQSRCDLKLKEKLDYEARSMFVMQVIAENAWTNPAIDTRNVAVHDFIVIVEDVPDSPPYFLVAPPVTRLPETAKEGDEVLKVSAYDGDYANPRKLRYGLSDETNHLDSSDKQAISQISSYFKMNPDTGIISLRKDVQRMGLGDIDLCQPIVLKVSAEEVVANNEKSSSLQKIVRPQISEVDIAIIIDDVINREPRFLQKHYITNLVENAPEGTILKFEGGLDMVEDLDKGENGMLELSIKGKTRNGRKDYIAEDTFEIAPSIIYNRRTPFVISVKNNKKLDYENLKNIEFEIVAKEVKPNGFQATAEVSVNVMNANDNFPVFQKPIKNVESRKGSRDNRKSKNMGLSQRQRDSSYDYEVSLYENAQPGTLVLQVAATDADENEVKYEKLFGSTVVEKSFSLDEMTGEIRVIDNSLLDREISEDHIAYVQATDGKGKTSHARIHFVLLDKNDSPPRFKKHSYQGFMNSELTHLRNDLQVEAIDADKPNTKNSQIRYEIISGNYDKKFRIDEITGVLSVIEPLGVYPALDYDSTSKADYVDADMRTSQLHSSGLHGGSIHFVDPVITLIIRAYDLGIPSLSSEVPVQIFTSEVSSRSMRFIVAKDPETVGKNYDQISDLISTMTGGQAEIQNIQPYDNQFQDREDSGNYDLGLLETQRNPKKVDQGPRQSKRSVVDVFVRYPSDSVVDIDDVTNKLTNGNSIQSAVNINITSNQTQSKLHPSIVDLQRKNASLFWGLIIFCLVVVLIIIVIICCNCCPGCYYYNNNENHKRKRSLADDLEVNSNPGPSEDHDITVLTVKNERGEDLKDAKFVEIMKSARNRLSSAMSRGRGNNRNLTTMQNLDDSSYNNSMNNRLFETSGRPRLWKHNSVVPANPSSEILVLQDSNTPFVERSRLQSTLPSNEKVYFDDGNQVNQRLVTSIQSSRVVPARRVTDSILLVQSENRLDPNIPAYQQINLNSVSGDGVSSYRTMSINNPPQINHGPSSTQYGLISSQADNANQNNIVLHDSRPQMLHHTRDTQYMDNSSGAQNFPANQDTIQILQLEDGDSIFTEESARNPGGPVVRSFNNTENLNQASERIMNYQQDVQHKFTQSESTKDVSSPIRNVEDPRRTQSDIDIHDRDHILSTHRKSNSTQIASDGGEFYTAIGTDGKEMILQRYNGPMNDLMSSKRSTSSLPLGAQSDDDRGFLNMAMSHLQRNENRGNASPSRANHARTENIVQSDASVNKRRYNLSSSLENLGSGETSTSSDDDIDSYRKFGTNSDQNSNGSSVKKRRHKKKYRKHRQSSSLKNVEEMIDEISADQKQQKQDGDPAQKNLTSVGTSYSPIQDDVTNHKKDDMANNNNVSSMSTNTNFPFDLTPKHHIRSPIIEDLYAIGLLFSA